MDKGSSSRASSSRARELRARRRLNAKTGVELLDVLPPDILVHILVLLPTTRDLCQMDMVCRLFAFGTSEFGRQSLVEAALRIRHFAQTGLAVPGDLIREPWWPWASTKAKLVHDERCRRGVRLEPLVPDTVVNSDMDQRKGIVFFRRAGCARARALHAAPPCPPAGRARAQHKFPLAPPPLNPAARPR